MSIFNPPHFLRHIGMPTLREFTEAHALGAHLTLDWTLDEVALPAMVSQAVEALATELPTREITTEARTLLREEVGKSGNLPIFVMAYMMSLWCGWSLIRMFLSLAYAPQGVRRVRFCAVR